MAERLHRRTVVEQAADLADRIGLEELTMTKVGRDLGIAPPGVYRHVADLSDLRRRIGSHAAEGLAAALASQCAGLSGADALSALATTMREWAGEHPGQYAALQVAPGADDEDGEAASNALLTVIASALRAYDLEGDDLTDAIRFLRSTVHGFVLLEQNEGFKQPRDTDVTYKRIIAALDAALRNWGGSLNPSDQ